MRQILLAFVAGMAMLILATDASAWPGTVVAVDDGDTITVRRADGGRERIRLYGIDSPEKTWKGRWEAQPFSRVAANFVRDLFARDGTVDVAIFEMGESYERIVAGVIMLDGGHSVQEKLVGAGLAWVDPLYCDVNQVRECRNWIELEREAARERRGLWQALDWKDKPVAPWKWRGSKSLKKRVGGMRHMMEERSE